MNLEIDRFKERKPHHAVMRDFTLWDIFGMTEEECFDKLIELRWGGIDHVICPSCGAMARPYLRRNRQQLRCRHCDHHFSPVANSPFMDKKIEYSRLLMALSIYASGAKGVPALHMARMLDLQHKSAFALTGKIRESLLLNCDQDVLSGHIEIDGGHFCGKPRKGNFRTRLKPEERAAAIIAKLNKQPLPTRMPRSKAEIRNFLNRKEKRRIVMVLREIHPEKGFGAVRTRVAVATAESEKAASYLARKLVQPNSLIMTDENAAYSALASWCVHKTVEHSLMFSGPDGENENQAESYFSRLRRAEYGTYHGFRPKYLTDYAQEFAWREDMRRSTELEKLKDLCRRIFKNGPSTWWRGYWQGHHRPGEHELIPG